MPGQKAPARRPGETTTVSRNTLLVSDCGCRLRAGTGEPAADGGQLPPGSPRGAAHGLPAWSSSSRCSRCPRTIRRKLACAGGLFRRARSLARRNADRSGDTMNAFTSDDLKADAFPQASAGPPGVHQTGDRAVSRHPMPDAAARLSAPGRADHRCTAGSVAARPSNGLGWPRGQLRGELAEASGDVLDVLGPVATV